MLIAGISGYERNCAVALYRDGDLVAVCEEGRVRRVRDLGIRDGGFPRAALDVALATIGMRADAVTELDNLPLIAIDGEMLPCAEAWLSERAADALEDRGIMAWLSVQGTPAIRLHRWIALAAPLQPLAGL